MGNDILKRRITNVADPVDNGDVVNFKTLKEWVAGNSENVEKVRKRAFGGTALAMAMAGGGTRQRA